MSFLDFFNLRWLIDHDVYLIGLEALEDTLYLHLKGANVQTVLIIHGHHDHVFSLNQLKYFFLVFKYYVLKECKAVFAATKKDNNTQRNLFMNVE